LIDQPQESFTGAGLLPEMHIRSDLYPPKYPKGLRRMKEQLSASQPDEWIKNAKTPV
jgi:hypothetical protein